ncbi:MAG: PilZ domain-containing protein [Deltaproteobacteria bacterium]|nr:PilZ domain-containing protein [Deltaproteobacteria bacterium]
MISQVITEHAVPGSPHQKGCLLIRAEFCDFDEFVLAYTPDIEGGGIFLETPNLVPPRTKINIEFSITSTQLKIVEGLGEVVQVVKPAPETVGGIFIRFLDLKEKSKKLLSKLSESYI